MFRDAETGKIASHNRHFSGSSPREAAQLQSSTGQTVPALMAIIYTRSGHFRHRMEKLKSPALRCVEVFVAIVDDWQFTRQYVDTISDPQSNSVRTRKSLRDLSKKRREAGITAAKDPKDNQ
jgi:hypothetical protein